MRVLTFFPDKYSLTKALLSGLRESNFEFAKNIDYIDFKIERNIIQRKLSAVFTKSRQAQNETCYQKINTEYVSEIDKNSPDAIVIYNHQLFLPATLEYAQKKGIKICFFLGDHPLYSNTYDYNLMLLKYAHHIACPDSYWVSQLRKMGFQNATFNPFYYEISDYRKIEITEKHDIVFIGNCHSYSWGYKRLLFLNEFADFDLKIYGSSPGWQRWSRYFPKLNKKIEILDRRMSFDYMYSLIANAKLYPIEANPGLMHGIHIRFFEAISLGTIPLCEFQNDYSALLIKELLRIPGDYDEISGLCKHYLTMPENEYKDVVMKLKKHFSENYSTKIFLERMFGEN